MIIVDLRTKDGNFIICKRYSFLKTKIIIPYLFRHFIFFKMFNKTYYILWFGYLKSNKSSQNIIWQLEDFIHYKNSLKISYWKKT